MRKKRVPYSHEFLMVRREDVCTVVYRPCDSVFEPQPGTRGRIYFCSDCTMGWKQKNM